MCLEGGQGRLGPGDHDHPCEDLEALGFGVTSVHVPHVLSIPLELPDWFLTQSPFLERRVAPFWLFWRCWT